ncbi:ATP-binding protein [Dethiosulfovibrio salsuginis]|uniref:histidine kinase n=1 Tax=Dethiosulfovibrio salsuginis TaxID=561720 RepID=A0A1X7K3S8_9BACT|nr:ATP-binding protein [Dethiosulfovibrio salsuginis]SMG34962.1 PAS domain S-box-containing protein [Dethiosulfovibrio salsuginis]
MKITADASDSRPHQNGGKPSVVSAKLSSKNLTTLGTILLTVLAVAFILTGVLLIRLESERHRWQEVDRAQQALNALGESLKYRIDSNIYKVVAVEALVAMNPDLTQEDFARAMEVQFRGDHDLRNIGLARDMIIRFMYPIEGNEAAVGLDYRTLPDQFEAVDLARRLDKIVLAGPLDLVQGGRGLVARIPLSVKDEESKAEEFWGLASVVIDCEALFTGAGLGDDHDGLSVAIKGKDGLGADGDVFWGDPSVFDHSPIVFSIELPYGSWQIGAIPSTGWSQFSSLSDPTIWIYLTVASILLAFTGLIVFLLNRLERTESEHSLLVSSLEIFLRQTTDFIYFKDSDSRFIFCSQTLADITGHDDWKDMIGKHDFEVFPHDTATIYNEEEKPVIEEGKPLLNKINPYYLANGELGYVQINKWPVFDENNAVNGIFGISRDITEHQKAVEELRSAKEEAESANKAKSEFLANMSHEIRTPLNGVIGFTDLLRSTPLSPIQKEYVENANVSGHTLLGIINDILDFSKIEAGMIELEMVPTDMVGLLKNCVDIVRYPAGKKNLEVSLNVDPSMPPFAMVDPIRLKQVLINLLSNGVKFTEKGEVTLEVRHRPLGGDRGVFSFFVRDTGIGIADEQRERLFKAFSQADSSTTRKFGGTGLGLVISEMIAQKMGSTIQLDSVYGEGTTFSLDLVAQYAQVPDDLEEGLQEPDGTQRQDGSILTGRNGIVVLVAEDVSMNMLLTKSLLNRVVPGVTVVEAENGAVALDKYRESPPDIILMDIHMPEMDGLEATKAIRELERISGMHVPIIALTAGVLKDEMERCKEAGMDDFLTKPIEVKKLQKALGYRSASFEGTEVQASAVHFDKKQLIDRCGADDACEIILLMKKDISAQVESIGSSTRSDDRKSLKLQLHRLKGAALSGSLPGMATMAAEMERMVVEDVGKALLEDKYNEFMKEWEATERELKIP